MPRILRGNNPFLNNNRLQASQTADVDVNKTTVIHDQNVFTNVKLSTSESYTDMTDVLTEEAEIVHINKKSADECAGMVKIGNRNHKALWDTGAGRCVMSYDCYQNIPTKFKTELFCNKIKIKASNGT